MAKIELSTGWQSAMIARLTGQHTDVDSAAVNAALTGLFVGGPVAAGGDASRNDTKLRLMKGTIPADFSTISTIVSRTNDLLMEFTSSAGDLDTSQLAVNPINVSTIYKTPLVPGVATWFWLCTGTVTNGVRQGIFGSVGATGSGADLEMTDTTLLAGEQYRIMNLQLRFPVSWTY